MLAFFYGPMQELIYHPLAVGKQIETTVGKQIETITFSFWVHNVTFYLLYTIIGIFLSLVIIYFL